MASPVSVLKAPYPIVIGSALFEISNFLEMSGQWLQAPCKQIFIITDTNVAPLHLEAVVRCFAALRVPQIESYLVPAGEASKQFAIAEAIWSDLIDKRFTRQAWLLALGGGVIGDLTGFVASTFLRGVNFIQCPTTLLAQVDASIGGKTALNHPKGKNLVGTFYPPQAVLSNLDFLQSLPDREYCAALAEAIKYGVIAEPELITWIEDNQAAILIRDQGVVSQLVLRCSQIKSDIVSQDPEDTRGFRASLNLGHTLGHALEVVQGYQGVSHGEAVAIGLIYALHLSDRYFRTSELITRIAALCDYFLLPTRIPVGVSADALIESMGQDKKNQYQTYNFVLLEKVGMPRVVSNLSRSTLRSTLHLMGAS